MLHTEITKELHVVRRPLCLFNETLFTVSGKKLEIKLRFIKNYRNMASQGTNSTEEHGGRSNIISLPEIHRFMERCMTKVGTSESDAKALADVLVAGDHRGHFSHGLNRLGTKSDDPLSPDYVPSIFHFTRSPLKRRKAAELCKYENRKEVTKRRKEQQKRHEAAAGLLGLAFIESAGTAATDSSCTDSADELEATCDNFDFCTSQYTTET
ncbi:uncharacterized protein LOC143226392 [Tachypleus tridentatus]|uniref:uncharacterized protein LOC143226392 n=1 Tax=Tachypleus tridentatus TaxID=6853 RepID=UPI003FD636C6